MSILKKLSICAFAAGLAVSTANAAETVRFWYHFDNPENPMSDLVAKFEAKNPDIKIEAENVPWNSYYDNLYTSLVGGNAPDAGDGQAFCPASTDRDGCARAHWRTYQCLARQGRSSRQSSGVEQGSGRHSNIICRSSMWSFTFIIAPTFSRQAGFNPPKTCEEFRTAAKKLTKAPDTYGFGLRGGKGGWDQWGDIRAFRKALQARSRRPDQRQGVAANQWLIDLFQKDKVIPPSAPNDGFQEIVAAFKAGKTAMTIHHIGSSNDLVKALGDKVSAVPVPACNGNQWTSYGDESLAIFSSSQVKDAAWKWISFLAEGENNVAFNKATGQMTVTKSGAEELDAA